MKIGASGPITSWQIDGETMEIVRDFIFLGSPDDSAGKESACNVGNLGAIPGLGRPLEKGKATHSSILAWRIPWTVYSMGS